MVLHGWPRRPQPRQLQALRGSLSSSALEVWAFLYPLPVFPKRAGASAPAPPAQLNQQAVSLVAGFASRQGLSNTVSSAGVNLSASFKCIISFVVADEEKD